MSQPSNLVAEARMFALEVADLVARHTDNCPTLVAAAWLHDVVEDTAVSASEIERLFGGRVAELVVGVTDVSTPEAGNRASRKALDRQHIARQSSGCKTIKLADMISNVATVAQRDPAFARIYLAEKRQLLEVLQDGNADLLRLATMAVAAGLQALGDSQSITFQ